MHYAILKWGDRMARQARKRSETGIYHIMLRGIDKRDIFMDDADRIKFIEKLLKARETADFKLYGYCLMDNHVHILIGETEEIGTSIKRITVGYVQWHNYKYARTGHLFQNRYASEPVETESYLVNVLRYIHQNPVKAKIIKHLSDYLWSSYNQYISVYQDQNSHVDAQLIKEYFKKQEHFEEYMNAPNKDECLDYEPLRKYTDSMLLNILQKEMHVCNLKEMPANERNKIIKDIYHEKGISIRQLGRVLELGKTIIEKAVRQDE